MYVFGSIICFIIGLVLAFITGGDLTLRYQWKMIDKQMWFSIPIFFLGIYLMYLPFS